MKAMLKSPGTITTRSSAESPVSGWSRTRNSVRKNLHLPTSLLRPLIDPIVHRLVPELAVLRLEHPVSLIREVQHLRRHIQALQSGEELESLRHIQPVVELAVDDERRSLKIQRRQV